MEHTLVATDALSRSAAFIFIIVLRDAENTNIGTIFHALFRREVAGYIGITAAQLSSLFACVFWNHIYFFLDTLIPMYFRKTDVLPSNLMLTLNKRIIALNKDTTYLPF